MNSTIDNSKLQTDCIRGINIQDNTISLRKLE